MAMQALAGVGDSALGEWSGPGNIAFHFRRRLSAVEVALSGLKMLDLRGTATGTEKLRKLLQQHPHIKSHAIAIGEWA